MEYNQLSNDRVIIRVNNMISMISEKLHVEVKSVVLFGSRVRGIRNSQNEYEILIFLQSDIDLKRFITFTELITLELLREKIHNVKIKTYTPDIFENILYTDKILGTYLYMMCRECVILYDKYFIFREIQEKLFKNNVKDEEVFLNQCVDFARMFESEKWAEKWEKTLMQFRYLRKRRKM